MTEWSGPFTNGQTDGGPWSVASWWRAFRILTGQEDAGSGVLLRWGNSLAPTSPGADQVAVASGAALNNGTVYENDASTTLAATRPTVGTTGKRVVLRKDITNGGVRLAVIASADGTATLPSLTQSATTWDIPICSFTHATNGTIGALTDEREFATIGGATMPHFPALSLFPAIWEAGTRNVSLGTAQPITGTANRVLYHPFTVTEAVTIRRLGYEIGTQSGNIDLGIYDSDADGKPRTRLAALGSTACPLSGAAVADIGDVTLQPGLYFVGCGADNTTVTILALTAGGFSSLATVRRTGTCYEAVFPLPATATPLQNASGPSHAIPEISILRAA